MAYSKYREFSSNELRELSSALNYYFNEEEIRTLCFDLDIDYDSIGYDSIGVGAKSRITRELIDYLQRRGRLGNLVSEIKRARPSVKFSFEKDQDLISTSIPKTKDLAELERAGSEAQANQRVQDAEELFSQMRNLAREIGNKTKEARALHLLAGLRRDNKDFKTAISFYEQSLAVLKQARLPAEITTLRGLSEVLAATEAYTPACVYLQEAIALVQHKLDTIDDHLTLARLHLGLAQIFRTQRQFEQAEVEQNHAYEQFIIADDQSNAAITQNEIGLMYLQRGQFNQAINFFSKALSLIDQEFNTRLFAEISNNVGTVYVQQQDWSAAEKIFRQNIALFSQLRDRKEEAIAVRNLAEVLARQNAFTQAIEQYQRSLALFTIAEDAILAAGVNISLGDIHLEQANLQQAITAYQAAQGILIQRGDKNTIALVEQKIEVAQRRQTDQDRPRYLLIAEAKRFFENAGFLLNSTGEDHSIICNTKEKRDNIKGGFYACIFSGKRLTSDDILKIRDQAKNIISQSQFVLVVTDKEPQDDALAQITTERLKGVTILPINEKLLYEAKSSQQPNAARHLLQTHLRDMMGDTDPYSKSTPVTDSTQFYGRETLADELTRDLIDNGKHIALYGLRKMGKSSLMRYMQFKMPAPAAWLDLQQDTNPVSIAHRALQAWQIDAETRFGIDLGMRQVKREDIGSVSDFVAFIKQIIAKLQSIKHHPAKLVLFLDEIELLMPRTDSASDAKAAQSLEFMAALRGLVQENGVLSIMVAGVDPAITRNSRVGEKQNPFFQMLEERFLPPLSVDDCKQMVRVLGGFIQLEYSDEALTAIAIAGGGHPFYTRKLCSFIYNQRDKKPSQITLQDVKEACDEFIFDPSYSSVISQLWTTEIGNAAIWTPSIAMTSQRILEKLSRTKETETEAILIEPKEERPLRKISLKNMERLSVVQLVPQTENKSYQITFGLFKNWIRQAHLGLTN